MNVDRAMKIMDLDQVDDPESSRPIFEGICMLVKVGAEDTEFSVEHDMLFFGYFEETVANMSEEQVSFMRNRGWMEMNGSWMTFV